MNVKDLLVKLVTIRKVGVASAEMGMVRKDHQLIHVIMEGVCHSVESANISIQR